MAVFFKHMKTKLRDAIVERASRHLLLKIEKLEKQLGIANKKADDLRMISEELFYLSLASFADANRIRFTDDLKGVACYRGIFDVVMSALPGLTWSREMEVKADACFLWGCRASDTNMNLVLKAARDKSTIVFCEDGFLRSADTNVNPNVPERFRHGCSVIFDQKGFYFDATKPSTIEDMLNDRTLVLTDEQRREARRVMDLIVSNKLTKYNHQPIYVPEVGRKGRRKVLVVDQSYGDFAIRKGWGSEQTFMDMLETAKKENPDADILVKTHPDAMTGMRTGYYDNVKEEGNVYRVTIPINPYSLMEQVDKVYVCSTQLGFEALMAGKDVYVAGMPFYAGWGLTEDRQVNPRRTNRRSLEEVFYIFYMMYTHWVDVKTGKPCTIDQAIANLIELREDYAKELQRQKSNEN